MLLQHLTLIFSQVMKNGEQVKSHIIDCTQCAKMHSIDVCEKTSNFEAMN